MPECRFLFIFGILNSKFWLLPLIIRIGEYIKKNCKVLRMGDFKMGNWKVEFGLWFKEICFKIKWKIFT